MKTPPIRLAVLGLGRAGWSIHLNQIQNDSRFKVVSVADPDPLRTEEAATTFGCNTYATLPDLLHAGGIDLMVVATPSFCHAKDVAMVLQAGIDCIAEKPMANSYEESLEIVRLAEQSGRKLFVHHQQPFRAEFNHLREVIDSGILGDVFHIDAYWARYGRRWDWQTLRKNGGGQLSNHGSHALSVVLPLLDGEVIDASADMRNIKDAGDAEDHVNLLLKGANGRTASIIVTSVCALPVTRWRLLGSRGTLESDGEKSTLRYYGAEAVSPLEVIDAAAPDRAYQREELPWRDETRMVRDSAGTVTFYDNVYAVLREGAAMRVAARDALEIMRVMDMARQDAGQLLMTETLPATPAFSTTPILATTH